LIDRVEKNNNFATLLEKAGSEFFLNDIYFFSFSSQPTNPKFLAGWPKKQQINLEWPYNLLSIGSRLGYGVLLSWVFRVSL